MPSAPVSRSSAPFIRALAASLAALVVVLLGVAQRPDWHARLHAPPAAAFGAPTAEHAHCNHGGHDGSSAPCTDAGCALTWFAQGHVDAVTADQPIAGPPTRADATVRWTAERGVAALDRRLPHGCGPPRG